MRFILSIVLLGCLSLSTTTTAQPLAPEDVSTNFGTGSSVAALAIDFADGNTPLLFSYNFDGPLTAEQLLNVVLTQDTNLYLKASNLLDGTATGFGTAVYGIGYDTNSNGFSLDDATDFGIDRLALISNTERDNGAVDDALSNDGDDLYQEGWNTGFWGFYTTSVEAPSAWGFSNVGLTTQAVVDGQWIGLAYAPAFASLAPNVSVIPEPTAAALMGVWMLFVMRRRGARCMN